MAADLEVLFGAESPYGLVTYVLNADDEDALNEDEVRETLALPPNTPLLQSDPSRPNDSALQAFLELTDTLRPVLERAKARNRIPTNG